MLKLKFDLMIGLIGKKTGMTSIYDEAGKNYACTVIEVEPNVVAQVKTIESDGAMPMSSTARV